jgi:hypothetical protein
LSNLIEVGLDETLADPNNMFVPRDSASRKTFFATPSFLPKAAAVQTYRACTVAALPQHPEEVSVEVLLAWHVGAGVQHHPKTRGAEEPEEDHVDDDA